MNIDDNCTVCDRKVQSFSIHLSCVNCKTRHHAKCVNFDRDDVAKCELWYCPTCMKSIFVYNHYDDDDDFLSAILEGVIHSTVQFHEMNSQIFFPFEVNETINWQKLILICNFIVKTIILEIQTVITTWRKCSIII